MMTAPGTPLFVPSHLVRSTPLRVRAKPLSDGWIITADRKDGPQDFRLRHLDRDRPLPEALDGVAFSTLPLALRDRQMLHIEGPVTRSALRNLREIGEAWSSWDPGQFAAVEIDCDSVIDDVPSEDPCVIAAWSGDLRSTFTLAGGETALEAAGYRIGTVIHVPGLGGPVPADSDLRRVAETFRAAGIDWAVVSTDAGAAGIIDPVIGVAPIMAAALHLVGGGLAGIALHAEAHPLRAQIIRPRPRPTLGNVYSGDRLAILSVGGTASLPAMVAHLARRPELRPLLLGCRASGFRTPRCGRCADCRRLDLGLQAAGLTLPGDREQGAVGLGNVDADLEAEAILAVENWAGGQGARLRLMARLAAVRIGRARRDHAAWRKAMTGEAEPWPR